MIIPQTREGRAADLKELRETLARIQEGQKDPFFAAFYETVREGVEAMEARHDVLAFIADLEEKLETAHTSLAVVASELNTYHKNHACSDGCVVCDALESAEIVLKGTGAQLP
jgi:hypothetical protein